MDIQTEGYKANLECVVKCKRNHKLLVGAFFILFILFLVTCLTPYIVSAESDNKKIKTIETIQIASGDTIWDLAKQYYTKECGDFKGYVAEIKKSNGLTSDKIHTGNYLIIPYYTE